MHPNATKSGGAQRAPPGAQSAQEQKTAEALVVAMEGDKATAKSRVRLLLVFRFFRHRMRKERVSNEVVVCSVVLTEKHDGERPHGAFSIRGFWPLASFIDEDSALIIPPA